MKLLTSVLVRAGNLELRCTPGEARALADVLVRNGRDFTVTHRSAYVTKEDSDAA